MFIQSSFSVVSVVVEKPDSIYNLSQQAGFIVSSDVEIECKYTLTFEGYVVGCKKSSATKSLLLNGLIVEI